MTGTEIIEALVNNPGDVLTAVGSVTSAVLTAIFLRSNTSTKEFEKLKAGQFGEALEEMLKNGQMTYTELYKSKNFLAVAKKADEYYSQMPHGDDVKEHNFDWYVRFYENVGNISDETMQELWAKILAGEINKPHSYSLMTLDALKNIGQQEAELFSKILQSCIFDANGGFLPNYRGYLDENGIIYSEIMYLNEHGLIHKEGTIVLNLPMTEQGAVAAINRYRLCYVKWREGNKEDKFKIKQYPLTAVGLQIASLIDGQLTDEKFISFARHLQKEHKNYDIGVYDIAYMDSERVSFGKKNYLEESENET